MCFFIPILEHSISAASSYLALALALALRIMHHTSQAVDLPTKERRPLADPPAERRGDTYDQSAQAVDDGAPEHDEADHGPDELRGDGLVVVGRPGVRREWPGPWQRERGAGLEVGAGLDGEEQGADAHRSKMPAEQGLLPRLDVRDEPPAVQRQDDGEPPQEQDEREEQEEGGGIDVAVQHVAGPGEERPPGDHGAEVDEDARVQHEVHDALEGRLALDLLGLARKPSVVREPDARAEGDQEVVQPQGAPNADAQHGQQEVEGDETRPRRVPFALGEAQHVVCGPSDDTADCEPERALVQDRDEQPVRGGLARGPGLEDVQACVEERETGAVVACALGREQISHATGHAGAEARAA